LTEQLKSHARELGFDLFGVAPAVTPEGVARLEHWLERGFAGEMSYMVRQAGPREHPRHLLTGVRSIVIVAMNYRTVDPPPAGALEGRVSRYAWGDDYHGILRHRLQKLADFVHTKVPQCRTRIAVDTAPLLERDFARLAGIGWIGKNTMLINKRLGSWLFLGALLTDVELDYDTPHEADHCGTCTRCLDACPTQAFAGPHQLDSRRCISYLTIELRGPIPQAMRSGMGNWLFGCDVCQEVCPWNRKAPRTDAQCYAPRTATGNVDLARLLAMDDSELARWTEGTTLTRAGLRGLRRNAAIALGNTRSSDALGVLHPWTTSPDAAVRDAAQWAEERILGADDKTP
jgi:epoxyqueuosine reductase